MSIEYTAEPNILSKDEIKNYLKDISLEKGISYVHLRPGAKINGETVSCFCLWKGMGGKYFISTTSSGGKNLPCIVNKNKPVSGESIDDVVDIFFQGIYSYTDIAIYVA